jgi:hypothetical protein
MQGTIKLTTAAKRTGRTSGKSGLGGSDGGVGGAGFSLSKRSLPVLENVPNYWRLRSRFEIPNATVGQECPTYSGRRMGIPARPGWASLPVAAFPF